MANAVEVVAKKTPEKGERLGSPKILQNNQRDEVELCPTLLEQTW